MNERILVTGASGFVGKRLLPALRRQGHYAVGMSDTDSADAVCAIDDEGLREILAEVRPTIVYHLATLVSGSHDGELQAETCRAHIRSTHALTRALKDFEARLIVTGSYEELGDAPVPYFGTTPARPVSPSGYTKLMVTEQTKLYAIANRAAAMVIRAAHLYGPEQRPSCFVPALLTALKRGEPFDTSPGEQRREYLFVEDFVKALVAAIGAPIDPRNMAKGRGGFRILHVGNGAPVTLEELAALAEEIVGVSGLVRLGARPCGDSEPKAMFADPAEAEECLGWQPTVTLEEGLRITAESIDA